MSRALRARPPEGVDFRPLGASIAGRLAQQLLAVLCRETRDAHAMARSRLQSDPSSA
jgi:hypothetical protein